jgi:hypothetical protein
MGASRVTLVTLYPCLKAKVNLKNAMVENKGLSALDAGQLALQFTKNMALSPTEEDIPLRTKLLDVSLLKMVIEKKMIGRECILEIGLEGFFC